MDRWIFILGTLVIGVMTAVLSWALSFVSARAARRAGALDQPCGERKIHKKPIPLFGGLGIALSFLIAVFLLSSQGLLPGITLKQTLGLVLAVVILLIGGLTDDRWPRPAWLQFIFPLLAGIAIIVSGTGIIQISDPFNPHAPWPLVWWRWEPYHISWPADLITLLWLMFATYATKLLDGLDGLVAGMAVIGATMVGALTLSSAYFQPSVALLAGAAGGSFLGFLPRNTHPAKQFLGETGSTLAGFLLGFLAIVSSAKIAIALAVLAIPIADAALVVIGRLRRGASPFHGDASHLHFRLLRAGLPHRAVVALLWGAALAAGVIALGLQTRGKIFLVAALVALTALGSWFTKRLQSVKESKIYETKK